MPLCAEVGLHNLVGTVVGRGIEYESPVGGKSRDVRYCMVLLSARSEVKLAVS